MQDDTGDMRAPGGDRSRPGSSVDSDADAMMAGGCEGEMKWSVGMSERDGEDEGRVVVRLSLMVRSMRLRRARSR